LDLFVALLLEPRKERIRIGRRCEANRRLSKLALIEMMLHQGPLHRRNRDPPLTTPKRMKNSFGSREEAFLKGDPLHTERRDPSACYGSAGGRRPMAAGGAMRISEGKPYPLGATADAKGANFAVFSANATRVEACLFDADDRREIERFELTELTDEIFHGHLADVGPATLYGFRVDGPFEPEAATASTPTSCCSTLTREPTRGS
jgi:Carbohydrate-binding module 48 (Isoamylase N-terminal domain)